MAVPAYDADLFTDEALAHPYDHYRAMRDAGPVVWLTAHDVYAVARYREVRAILDDAATLISGEGVGLNEFINEGGRGTTIMSDVMVNTIFTAHRGKGPWYFNGGWEYNLRRR